MTMQDMLAHRNAARACWERGEWSTPQYPGDAVRMLPLVMCKPPTEMGDVRIQHYGVGSYRVASFLPGRTVCCEGDTPKTEPESEEWCETVAGANAWFDLFVSRAKRDGWVDYKRQ